MNTGLSRRRFSAWFAVSAILCWSACHSGTTEAVEVFAADLPCATKTDSGWESSPWFESESRSQECPWIRYPANALLTVEHGLGRRPDAVLVYLSFQEDGSNAALAVGDLATIIAVDDTRVIIENRTRERFALRVVLR